MKRITIIVAALLASILLVSIAAQSRTSSSREERHAARVQSRAERLANYEKHVDSLVMSQNFTFNPNSFQLQPAGSTRQIYNPQFEVGVWGSTLDILLPYIKGYTPPYRIVMLNYTVPTIRDYVAERTSEGWEVTFSSSLFSASTYNFTFEIFSRTGGANLTIANMQYNTVQYSGMISNVN